MSNLFSIAFVMAAVAAGAPPLRDPRRDPD